MKEEVSDLDLETVCAGKGSPRKNPQPVFVQADPPPQMMMLPAAAPMGDPSGGGCASCGS